MVFLILLWLFLRFIFLKITCKKNEFKNEIIINCFAIYIILLIRVTLLPISMDVISHESHKLNLEYLPINLTPIIPLIDNGSIFLMLKNILGNILLFLPFGLITPYIFKKLKNLKSMLITSLIISCSIETIQLIEYILSISENTRITDINDIILNVLGSFIGFYILKKFKLDKIRE
ncbi:MAG: VanZ family protein [Pantoea sp.]|jgi:glycopeptide antibiotics resistance protein|nr:VanZ family protein [Pantoea sp.]